MIALSLANAKVHISSTLDQKFLVPGELYLPSCPVEKYWGRTLSHRALVTWGPRGSIDCKSDILESILSARCPTERNRFQTR